MEERRRWVIGDRRGVWSLLQTRSGVGVIGGGARECNERRRREERGAVEAENASEAKTGEKLRFGML